MARGLSCRVHEEGSEFQTGLLPAQVTQALSMNHATQYGIKL